MTIQRLKWYIKILLGKKLYIPTQISPPPRIQVCGADYGSFPVLSEPLQEDRDLVVYSFGIGEDLSFSEGLLAQSKAHIYAFDPTPKAIAYVKAHPLAHNDRFTFFPYGISDKDGTEVFYLPKNEDYVSGSIINHSGVSNARAISVEMRTLKTLMQEQGHKEIDILKLDIEGSEFSVIPQVLESGCIFHQLCVEVHYRFLPNGKQALQTFIQLLNSYEYRIAAVLDSGEEILFVKTK